MSSTRSPKPYRFLGDDEETGKQIRNDGCAPKTLGRAQTAVAGATNELDRDARMSVISTSTMTQIIAMVTQETHRRDGLPVFAVSERTSVALPEVGVDVAVMRGPADEPANSTAASTSIRGSADRG